ncbi:hypothetical protein AX16_003873 [Volvariella volvacea WC 439]|nr:hypothetical protein AX16_003873 [Volvariella volvacea WC 439]
MIHPSFPQKACLLITLHYADQIWARTRLVTLTSLTCHRFVITSITVSSKALCDVFCTNTLYAKVGGIPVTELNTLEREFLGLIDWRVMCTRETLQEYYINLVRTSKDYVLAKEESSSSSNGASSSDSDDVDMDSGQSNPPSPSDQSSRTHRRRPSAYEASTILVDPDSNPQEVSRRPTIEQNMAFAELQQMGGPGIGGSNKFKHPGNS